MRAPTILEGCVTSLAQAREAVAGGAHRLELCSDLSVGGLTPSPTLVAEVIQGVDVPVAVMIRPRPGPFRLESQELLEMQKDMAVCEGLGVSGFVFGALNHDDSIDKRSLHELMAASFGLPVTFHKAFDLVADPPRELEFLIESGVKRVLTAGGVGTAWEGRSGLRRLVSAAGDLIEIIGAGRIRGDHVAALVQETGIPVVHSRGEAVAAIWQSLSA